MIALLIAKIKRILFGKAKELLNRLTDRIVKEETKSGEVSTPEPEVKRGDSDWIVALFSAIAALALFFTLFWFLGWLGIPGFDF